MRFYLDACALIRLADEKSQLRVRLEAEAVDQLLRHDLLGTAEWVVSKVLEVEFRQNRDLKQRADTLALLARARASIASSGETKNRGRELASVGYGVFDALHLAHAEAAAVDYLVTTDDRMIRQAARGIGSPRVRVLNPVDCMREVQTWPRQK